MSRDIPPEKTRFGAVLVMLGILSEDQLARAIDQQKRTPSKRLGDVLLDVGAVTKDDIARGLDWQKRMRRSTSSAARAVLDLCHEQAAEGTR